MPIYEIPADAKHFEIARGNDGTYLVLSETTGLHGVVISCRTEEQAIEVCERLNRGDHDGTIDVPFFILPKT